MPRSTNKTLEYRLTFSRCKFAFEIRRRRWSQTIGLCRSICPAVTATRRHVSSRVESRRKQVSMNPFDDQGWDVVVVITMSGVKKKTNHLAVFKHRTKNDDNAELSKSLIVSARKTGRLNLSSRGLSSGICTSTIYAHISIFTSIIMIGH